ncbi:MAG: response regulator transcription factor [Steroidobacteraceae bacterium]
MTHRKNSVAGAALIAPDAQVSALSPAQLRQPGSGPNGPQLAQFGAQTASFVSQLLGADWSCFYQIDEHSQPFGFRTHRTPWALREAYLKHDIARTDPLHPACLAGQKLRFLSLSDSRLSGPVQRHRNYWDFLSTFGTRDAAEMIFRVHGRAVAGLSLLWVGNSGTRAERQQGETVQTYVECNLAYHFREVPAHSSHHTDIPIGLTARELEIVKLICDGSTNVQIARRLGIGVATVKTHLLHVFEKLGVRTRAALVSRFLSATRGSSA